MNGRIRIATKNKISWLLLMISEFFFNLAFEIWYVLLETARIIRLAPIQGKLVAVLPYAGLIILFVLCRPAFWVTFGIVLFLFVIFDVYLVRDTMKTIRVRGEEDVNLSNSFFVKAPGNGPFDGMSTEDAKNELTRLFDLYRPGKEGGDLGKMLETAREYSRFCGENEEDDDY